MEIIAPSQFMGDITGNISGRRGRVSGMDVLGDIPGVGALDFSYVALVILALMVVVGPVDWLVLKLAGKQPWTWATTFGWIALVTTGGVYVGEVFKSGELHLRTVRLIDQADGRVAGVCDTALIYSPRTDDYPLLTPAGSWWLPLGYEPQIGRARTSLSTIRLDQGQEGCVPAPVRIHVWNLRLLCGQTIAPDMPAPIEADLTIIRSAPQPRIAGTIVNRSGSSISRLLVRINAGWADALGGQPPLENGASLRFDLPTTSMDWPIPESRRNLDALNVPADPMFMLVATGDATTTRSPAVRELIYSRANTACIYAVLDAPQPSVKLGRAGAVERHFAFVRALVGAREIMP